MQYNKLLGNFNLEGIAPAPRGIPQIEVTLDIDANGILHVSAKDKNTGKENKITIKANSGLSENEINDMIKDAEANADEDKKVVELVTARNMADAHAHSIKKEFDNHKDSLSEDECKNIETAIENIENSIKGDDVDAINQALTDSGEPCKVLYEKASETANEPSENAENTDDVVDAEFTEDKQDA